MKIYEYEGKNIEEVTEKALLDLELEEADVFIKETEEETGVFKTKKVKLEVLVKKDVLKFLKELLLDIVSKMGLEVNIEVKVRDNQLRFNLYSDNNSILIGKGGKTIDSLQTILKHVVSNKTHFYINISVDVEDYKERKLDRIKMLARNVSREVLSTGVEAKLDSMNSYERRLVHEEVSKIDGVHTLSDGVEPNRYVIIKAD